MCFKALQTVSAINDSANSNSIGESAEEASRRWSLVWEDSDGDGKTDVLPSYWSREKVANRDQLHKTQSLIS